MEDGERDSGSGSLEQLSKGLVRYALSCEHSRKPIKRQDINDKGRSIGLAWQDCTDNVSPGITYTPIQGCLQSRQRGAYGRVRHAAGRAPQGREGDDATKARYVHASLMINKSNVSQLPPHQIHRASRAVCGFFRRSFPSSIGYQKSSAPRALHRMTRSTEKTLMSDYTPW
jgi:hypothetical protein